MNADTSLAAEAERDDEAELRAALLEALRRFLTQRVRGLGTQRDAPIAEALLEAFSALDLWSMTLPEAEGGAGLSAASFVAITAELAGSWPSLAHVFAMHAGPGIAAARAAGVTTLGERLIGYTEGALLASAGEQRAGEQKAEGALVAQLQIAAAGRSVRIGRVEAAQAVEISALRGLRWAQVLRAEGAPCAQLGAADAEVCLRWADLAYAALSLGVTREALQVAVAYALERKQFGKPIADFQAIEWKIAEMRVGLEATQSLLDDAARSPDPRRAAMAAAYASKAAIAITSEALQIHGGYGYTREFPIERLVRAARHWATRGSDPRTRIV